MFGKLKFSRGVIKKMEITKENLKKIITRKRGDMQKELIEKEPKKSKVSHFKKEKIKKLNLDYEMFLQ